MVLLTENPPVPYAEITATISNDRLPLGTNTPGTRMCDEAGKRMLACY